MNLILALLCATISPASQPIQPCTAPTPGMNSTSPASLFRITWLDSVSGPPETTWTDTDLVLTGTAMLHASQNVESMVVDIQGWGGGGHWDHGAFYSLHAGDSVAVGWLCPCTAESSYYVVRESIIDSMPKMSQQDSFITWQFWVLRYPHGAVKEDSRQPSVVERPEPSILRCIPAGAIAFDAMGRQVTDPKPGVYFARISPGALPRKVLLVE